MKKLAKLMETRQLKSPQVARLAGISPVCVRYLAAGKRGPRLDTAEKLARGLGVRLGDLL